jgi:hypothetical protein
LDKHKIGITRKIKRYLNQISDSVLIVYFAVLLGIGISLLIKPYHEDLSLNLVSEIIGAAFIIFVIDFLLVRSKTKRWKIVQNQIDYLIARTISRLRDGMTSRAFSFNPIVSEHLPEEEILEDIRKQREEFLSKLNVLTEGELSNLINPSFFNEDNYEYFNEKADEIWNVLNMKYSEYLEPELVSLLMDNHSHLKDVCAHIRFFKKSERFPKEKEYYQSAGLKGAAHSFKQIIGIVIRLKEEGYSRPAK